MFNARSSVCNSDISSSFSLDNGAVCDGQALFDSRDYPDKLELLNCVERANRQTGRHESCCKLSTPLMAHLWSILDV